MAAIALIPSLGEAASSDSALFAEYPYGASSVRRNGSVLSVELCRDTCSYYVARHLRSEAEFWDAVFLHEYFYNADVSADGFRRKNAEHTAQVLKQDRRCLSGSPEERAGCLAKALAQRNDIQYVFVRYDEGFRCTQDAAIGAPFTPKGKDRCTRVKNAP